MAPTRNSARPHHTNQPLARASRGEFRRDRWDSITKRSAAIRLYDEDLVKLEKKDDDPLRPFHRIPEENGGGYAGMLQVFHLLHCLKMLRQGQVYNWDYYKTKPEWINSTMKTLQDHNDHCFDALRMTLMCYADVTPIVFFDSVANPQRKDPVQDFNTRHTCRNFDEILEWTRTTDRHLRADEIGDAASYLRELDPDAR